MLDLLWIHAGTLVKAMRAREVGIIYHRDVLYVLATEIDFPANDV